MITLAEYFSFLNVVFYVFTTAMLVTLYPLYFFQLENYNIIEW